MSFKREGNDDRWLSMLQKRRVSELLTEDIPEDEACVIKNGRLACLVCNYRPTFDTSEMLGIHRNGKKHQLALVVFQNKKQELEELKASRLSAQYGEVGMPSQRRNSSALPSFLKTQAYDPRAKKRKWKPNERKPVLQLDSEYTNSDDTNTTAETSLPGYRKLSSQSGISSTTATARPVTKLEGTNRKAPFTSDEGTKPKGPVKSTGPRQTLPQTISEYIKRNKVSKDPGEIRPYGSKIIQASGSSTINEPKTCSSSTDVQINSNVEKPVKKKKTKLNEEEMASSTTSSEESTRKKLIYLQATSSGWKLDWTGQKWIKDEDVEFDSDEEPPELPF